MNARTARVWIALCPLLVGLVLVGCAGPTERDDSVFTTPSEIQPNIAFWRNVYGKWSRGEVVLHDDEHLGVIYEVIDLPNPIREGYTSEQRRLISQKKSQLVYDLQRLERRQARGEPLDRRDRTLRDRIVAAAGSGALIGAHDRVRTQRGLRERFRRGLEVSGRYDKRFRAIFHSYGLPEDLAYLPHVESSFQLNARSSAGAAGVWQFTRGTGRIYMRVDRAVDERLDPILAADGAARYLRDAHAKLDSWPLAVTSYNHGQAGMQRARQQHGDDIGAIVRHYKGRYFGFASRNFYAEFVAARAVASDPERYFPEGVHYHPPLQVDRIVLGEGLTAPHIARHYALRVGELASLNPAWLRRVKEGRSPVPAGMTVWLPKGLTQRVAEAPRAIDTRVSAVHQTTGKSAEQVAMHRVHVVQPTETLYRIAKRYDLTVATLRRLNNMDPNNNDLRPGQRLNVRVP